MKKKYDIFISYRREGGYETAKHLYDLLIHDGYKVSFDLDTLRNGDFDTELLSRIEQCKDFILICDANVFKRTLLDKIDKNNDWLRIELAEALRLNKNIIPIFLNGFISFPENLPSDICKVKYKNSLSYNTEYFDAFYKKMKDFLTDSTFVDLGLSVKWCTCNVGATKPEEYGDYFAWGEIKSKIEYTWDNYFDSINGSSQRYSTYYHKSGLFNKKYGKTSITANSGNDAAREIMGEPWRMPTENELKELCEDCKWTLCFEDEKRGYIITGPNGNSIFLPASGMAGFYSKECFEGMYWSSELCSDKSHCARVLSFGDFEEPHICSCNRYFGLNIRPVKKRNNI